MHTYKILGWLLGTTHYLGQVLSNNYQVPTLHHTLPNFSQKANLYLFLGEIRMTQTGEPQLTGGHCSPKIGMHVYCLWQNLESFKHNAYLYNFVGRTTCQQFPPVI